MNIDIKRIPFKAIAVSIAVPLAVGGLSSLLTMGSMKSFHLLRQPPLTPPDWVFPVVWSILYILMGLGSYLAYVSADAQQRRAALTVYAGTLIMNFVWPLLFFRLGLHLTAFLWLIALLLLIISLLVRFYRIRHAAGLCILPYLLWALFAAYLNFGVYWLNRP